MSARLQVIATGITDAAGMAAVHLRWAFDPDLDWPVAGFDVHRRVAATDAGWMTAELPAAAQTIASAMPATPTSASVGGSTLTWGAASTTGDSIRLVAFAATRGALYWASGALHVMVTPPAARIAVEVSCAPTLASSIVTVTATSASGATASTSVTVTPQASARAELALADVTDVRVEGAGALVVAFSVFAQGTSTGWGPPLNGAVPIALPRSDTAAHLLQDLAARLTQAERDAWFGAPPDPAAVDELRELLAAVDSGTRWIASTAPDGGETRTDAVRLLLLLALRPEVARAFGLYFVDATAIAGVRYDYRVVRRRAKQMDAAEVYGVQSDVTRGPGAVASLTATASSVARAHPLSAAGRPILVRTPSAELDWTLPMRTGADLLDYESVLYFVDRVAAGPVTDATPTMPAANAAWVTLNADTPWTVAYHDDGSPVLPLYHDVPADVLQPLDGWQAYRVAGVNVFGLAGQRSPVATVRLADLLAPPPPRAVLGPMTGVDVAAPVTVGWTWGAEEALAAPDTAEFRVYLQARAPEAMTFVTGAVTSDPVGGRAVVPLVGDALPPDAGTALPGARLEVDGVSYLVTAAVAGGAQSVTVALAKGGAPAQGRAARVTLLRGPDDVWAQRVAVVAPIAPMTPCTLANVVANADGSVAAQCAGAAAAAGDVVYDRASGHSWKVTAAQAAGLALAPQGTQSPPVPGGAALLFPRQSVTIPAPLPANGTALRYLHVAVTAADASAAASDRIATGTWGGRVGNESAPARSTPVLVSDPTPPGAPQPGTDPDGPDVYATPADFYGRSYYTVQWTPAAGMRYQVLRALDQSIFAADAKRGANRVYADTEYPSLTNRQLADLAAQLDDAFTVRTPTPIVAGTFRDELPGGGPNRFVYRVAAVNDAGVRSSLSAPWAPVHVPDTIPPERPAITSAQIDPDDNVIVRWSQPALSLVTSFHVYRTVREADTIDVRLMGAPRRIDVADTNREGTTVAILDADVVDGVRYWYRVAAVREITAPIVAAIESPASDAIAVRAVVRRPPPPPVPVATFDVGTRTVRVAWAGVVGLAAWVQRSTDDVNWSAPRKLAPGAGELVEQPSIADLADGIWSYRVTFVSAGGRRSDPAVVSVALT